MGSGSDVVSGRDNGFESTTRMVGQRTTDFTAFAGDVIFEVVGISDPLFGIQATCTAIRGYGTNSGEFGDVTPGGTGVWGMGGPNAGTGVFGQGGVVSLAPPLSNGGLGVNGIGGDAGPAPPGGSITDPGAGVLGQGGAGSRDAPNAAGVVGVAGGTPVPDLGLTQETGVFGASTKGIGVSGRGNPGVVGQTPLAGGTGVFGAGTIGVFGVSDKGVGGVFALGALETTDVTVVPPNRAAVFGARPGPLQKNLVAQVHLIPQEKPPFVGTQPATPGAFITKGVAPSLSTAGKAGDLLYTTPANQPGAPGALWLCVISGTDKANPARWQQVLLGPMFAASG